MFRVHILVWFFAEQKMRPKTKQGDKTFYAAALRIPFPSLDKFPPFP
jgi:hypothetical protein